MLSRTSRGKYAGGLVVAAAVATVFAWSGRATVAGDEEMAEDLALRDSLAVATAPAPPADAYPKTTDEVIMQLAPGSDANAVGAANGLMPVQRIQGERDLWVMRALSAEALAASASITTNDSRVIGAYPNDRSANKTFAFVPNDPYFHKNTPVAGWPGQWHLTNEHVTGLDAGVKKAWNANWTGLGVKIGIVDDSLQRVHEDLVTNYIAGDSFDFGQGDADPSPVYAGDRHGTSVAGVSAARGNNLLGGTGAAPFARLAGLRVDFPLQTVAMFTGATLYHSSGANTNTKIKNHSYGYSAPYIPTGAETAALTTSMNAGTVHCLSAGNNRGISSQDSNKLDLQNGLQAICVAALGSDGTFASYSNFGATVACTAPSSSFKFGTNFGITTTDRNGALGYNPASDTFPDVKYTSVFGGTSSSSPLVAGVMALVKEAQPLLNARMAKHILSKTCTIVDPTDVSVLSDGGWVTNAGGRKFNQNYGWGNINAYNAIVMAKELTGLSAPGNAVRGDEAVAAAIPDNSAAGISRTFDFFLAGQKLEDVAITLSITHQRRGHLEAFLTSPSGTTSRLFFQSGSDAHNGTTDWQYTSNAFWGEDPLGTWTYYGSRHRSGQHRHVEQLRRGVQLGHGRTNRTERTREAVQVCRNNQQHLVGLDGQVVCRGWSKGISQAVDLAALVGGSACDQACKQHLARGPHARLWADIQLQGEGVQRNGQLAVLERHHGSRAVASQAVVAALLGPRRILWGPRFSSCTVEQS